MPGPSTFGRVAATVLIAALLPAPLSACSAFTAPPAHTATHDGQDTDMDALYAAVAAVDPRIEKVEGQVYYSGAARTIDVVVLIPGDQPVSTDTLTAVLVAIRDSTPVTIETVTVIPRSAEDMDKIIDISPAIAGLPSDVTALWDGGLTLARVDLDKL